MANETDSLLLQLEAVMNNRDQYQMTKEIELKSMKALLKEANGKPEQMYYVTVQIIKEYIPYTFDSALHYIEKNLVLSRKVNNRTMLNETELLLAQILTSSGQYNESLDVLRSINRSTLAEDLVDDYYSDYWKLYADLAYYAITNEARPIYEKLYLSYSDSLLHSLDPESDGYLMIIEKKLRDTRQMDACMNINTKRLSKCQTGTRTYSMVTFERSLNYQVIGNIEQQKKFLILSAISDIRSAIKDNASLTALAMILYQEKNVDRPHQYIQFAFEDAVFFNSKLRFIQISNILPVINKAYQLKTESQKAKLRQLVIIISILVVIVLLAMFLLYRQMLRLRATRTDLQIVNKQLKELNDHLNDTNDKLSQLNNELAESNHVKELYIGNFIAICSNYIDKLDNYRSHVNKQISAHKVAELFEYNKTKVMIENELKEFYENFDNTFLSIYPNFVEEINSLLVEEERIHLKKGELLNIELRIFALIRLGITDSSRIAGLLRYSVNTIYNYRAKVKNKSIVPREDFENIVGKLGVFYKNVTV
jgi:hypothetical protein